jgi:hypothetical protein
MEMERERGRGMGAKMGAREMRRPTTRAVRKGTSAARVSREFPEISLSCHSDLR